MNLCWGMKVELKTCGLKSIERYKYGEIIVKKKSKRVDLKLEKVVSFMITDWTIKPKHLLTMILGSKQADSSTVYIQK
jgi:hypothetical protein